VNRSAEQRLPKRLRALTAIVVTATALACSSCAAPRAKPVTPNASVTIATGTPPGLRAKQVLDMLSSDWPIGPNGVRMLAAPDARQSVETTMENLWWDRPFTVSGVDYYAGRAVLHLLNSFGVREDVAIHTDDDGRVDRLDAEVAAPTIKSWAEVETELTKSHARYSYQVAKVNDGRCERVAGANTAEALPLASIFKLYVLYAVSDAVKAGALSWDDQLTVTSRAKAVEFAALEQFPPGSTISVRAAADIMIASSSNMATDLLIDRVGTVAVERALVAAGHHEPQSMTPFPTMHELFSIGWGEHDLRQQWKDAASAPSDRARLLDLVDSAPYQPDPRRSHTPASTYGIEWYGSAEDICRVHAALQAGAVGAAAPVREIVAASPGIDLDREQWPYVGAKGGNLPGDLTFSWYAVDRRGQAWVVSFQLNWPRFHGPAAGAWVISIAKQVFAMVNRPG
jgi:beta-lactamase class A